MDACLKGTISVLWIHQSLVLTKKKATLTGPYFYKMQLLANARIHIAPCSTKTYTTSPEIVHRDSRLLQSVGLEE